MSTLKQCSWLYYCKYILNLPNSSNDGSSRGSVTHKILECLQRKSKRSITNNCARGDLLERIAAYPFSVKAISRLIGINAKKFGVADGKNLELIGQFISVALRNNFYLEHLDLQPPEYKFILGDPASDGYSVTGFIDKYGVCHKTKTVEIWDYKTSKSKFKGEELTNNLQALVYSLVMRKNYPDYKTSVNFLFLKFPKAPLQRVELDIDTIDGFEEMLKSVYEIISNFDYEAGKSNMASRSKAYSWLCGRCDYPGDTKDDGTLKWCCPYKFQQTYYAQVDENGNNIRTSYEESDLIPFGGKIVRKKYAGCPSFFE